MLRNRIVIERTHVADMHVRIDQSGNEKPAASIDVLRVWAGNKIGSNLCNPPVANNNNSVGEGSRALRRDDGHIRNHRSVVHNLPFGGVRIDERIENRSNQWKKPDKRALPHIDNEMRGMCRLDSAYC